MTMSSPIDTWHAGGPSLVDLQDQAFDQMKAAAILAIHEGREAVEVNARDLIALRTTAAAYEEMEAEDGRPHWKRHDHSSTDPRSAGPNGGTAYIDGCLIRRTPRSGGCGMTLDLPTYLPMSCPRCGFYRLLPTILPDPPRVVAVACEACETAWPGEEPTERKDRT